MKTSAAIYAVEERVTAGPNITASGQISIPVVRERACLQERVLMEVADRTTRRVSIRRAA